MRPAAIGTFRFKLLGYQYWFAVVSLPEMAILVETRSADVAIDRFEAPAPSRKIGMIWRKTSPLATQLSERAGKLQKLARLKQKHNRKQIKAGSW